MPRCATAAVCNAKNGRGYCHIPQLGLQKWNGPKSWMATEIIVWCASDFTRIVL